MKLRIVVQRSVLALAVSVAGLVAFPGAVRSSLADEDPDPVICVLPEELQAALEVRERQLWAAIPGDSAALQYVLEGKHKRWLPGSTVTVAFQGGSPQLHKQIVDVAKEWLQLGKVNLTLDFGEKPDGTFRQWRASDSTYAADIRISFASGGYWSLVGSDSSNEGIVNAGSPSMNLGGFATDRPVGWKATVLHEFGHALGFHHEHQHPEQGCDGEFRWEDDPGYVVTRDQYGRYVSDSSGRRPGIYTSLGGPPNGWSQAKVDHNLRQLQNSKAFLTSGFDRKSIMKYYFPSWMFRAPDSHCNTSRNDALSELDKQGVIAAYSPDPSGAGRAISERRNFLNELIPRSNLAPALKHDLQQHLQSME